MPKSKRKPTSRTSNKKTKTSSTTSRKTVHSQPTTRHGSKKARIIAMLQAPSGATIEAIARAVKWQSHSVRGFLAGVVRKKLDLTLVSTADESGRVYRITDRAASAA